MQVPNLALTHKKRITVRLLQSYTTVSNHNWRIISQLMLNADCHIRPANGNQRPSELANKMEKIVTKSTQITKTGGRGSHLQ
jgi:hypothetical protein